MRKQLLAILGAVSVSFAAQAQCGSSGTGVDGAFNATVNQTLAGGTYNYTTFSIASGVIVTVTGTQPLIINCTGAATIDGILRANGGAGANAVTFSNAGIGGVGVAGGANGGDGTYSSSVGPLAGNPGSGPGGAGNAGGAWSGGGGAGYSATGSSSGNSAGGFGGPSYGTTQISGMDAGSGGGGGSGGYSCGGGGGGAGGGYIAIHAASITISATGGIGVNGGNGGSDGTGNCGGGGGGSGGSIWLAASTVTQNGTLLANGGIGGASNVPGSPYYGTGANGAPGRIRIDYGTMSGTGTSSPAVGYNGTVSNLQAAAVVTQNVTCFGGSDGAALATNMNGTAPYTSSWSPSGGNTTVATGLSAGTYTYSVTDAAGCTATATVNVTEPQAMTISGTVTNVDCFGACNGSINVSVTGGTAPYTYIWFPTPQSLSATSNLCAGCYTVTVTDANGCTANGVFCVTEPPQLVATAVVTPPSCNGPCNGSATAMASGGIPPYSYTWCNAAVGSTINGLCPGNCAVMVTDSVGCMTTYSITVIAPPPAAMNLLGNDTMICDTDVLTLCATPGFSSYMWTPTMNTAPCQMADTSMCYYVYVTDSSGCTFVDSTCVTETFCMGISETGLNGFSIIPNPANDMISIAHGQATQQLVEIYDMNGKLCRSAMIADKGYVNIHDLEAGIYLVRVNGTAKKLVIER